MFKNWDLGVRGRAPGHLLSLYGDPGPGVCCGQSAAAGIRLSVEFLNWASNEAIGEAEDGGYFSDLWKGYAAYGICPEACMPYQQRFDPKLHPSAEATTQARALRKLDLELHWIKPWNPTTGLTDLQFVDINARSAGSGPFAAAFAGRSRSSGVATFWRCRCRKAFATDIVFCWSAIATIPPNPAAASSSCTTAARVRATAR